MANLYYFIFTFWHRNRRHKSYYFTKMLQSTERVSTLSFWR